MGDRAQGSQVSPPWGCSGLEQRPVYLERVPLSTPCSGVGTPGWFGGGQVRSGPGSREGPVAGEGMLDLVLRDDPWGPQRAWPYGWQAQGLTMTTLGALRSQGWLSFCHL